MAFQIAYTDRFGGTHAASYWRCLSVGVDLLRGRAVATFHGWVSMAAFQAGKQPVGARQYVFAGDDFAALRARYEAGETDLFAIANEWAKTHAAGDGSTFAGATEV